MKLCPHCNIVKPLEEFHRRGGDRLGPTSWCKRCNTLYRREYIHRPENIARHRRWSRKSQFKTMYGISLDIYAAMYFMQQGLCAVCKQPFPPFSEKKFEHLHVDHDHNTGEARGLVCKRCNMVVGLAENTKLMQSAYTYLQGPILLVSEC